MSFDQLIFNIAQDVRASLAGSPVGKKFVITNNCYVHERPGVHWVAVVYEIKAEYASQECASPEPVFGYGVNTRLDFEVDNDTDIPSLPSNFLVRMLHLPILLYLPRFLLL